jgi:hypothetical protein
MAKVTVYKVKIYNINTDKDEVSTSIAKAPKEWADG